MPKTIKAVSLKRATAATAILMARLTAFQVTFCFDIEAIRTVLRIRNAGVILQCIAFDANTSAFVSKETVLADLAFLVIIFLTFGTVVSSFASRFDTSYCAIHISKFLIFHASNVIDCFPWD
jgi:hypothetical protein